MLRLSSSVLPVLCVIMITGIHAQEAVRTVPIECFYPEETLFYYKVSNAPHLIGKMKALPITGLLEKILNELKKADKSGNITSQINIAGLTKNNIKYLFKGEAALGLYRKTKGKEGAENLEWCFVTDIGVPSKDLDFARESVFRGIRNKVGVGNITNTKYLDYTITTYFKGAKQFLNYTVFNNYLIVTHTKNELVKTVYRMKKKRNSTLVDNFLFKLVKQDPETPADARFFVDVAGTADCIKNVLPPDVSHFMSYLEPTGLLQIRAAFGLMTLNEKGVDETIRIYFEETKGFISLLETPKKSTFYWQDIPKSAVGVSVFYADPVSLWTVFNTMLKEYPKLLPGTEEYIKDYRAFLRTLQVKSGISIEKDILGNIGKNWAAISLPAAEGSIRGYHLIPIYSVEVFDGESVANALKAVLNKGLNLRLSVKKEGEQRIYYRQFSEMYFAFTVIKDKLYISIHPRMLAYFIRHMKIEKESVLEHQAVKSLADAGPCTAASWVDFKRMLGFIGRKYGLNKKITIKKLFEAALEEQGKTLAGMGISPDAIPFPNLAFPGLDEIGEALNVYTGRTVFKNNIFTSTYVSPVPIQVVLAGTGMAVVQMIPILKQQHEKGRVAVSSERLQEISFNLNLYSMEHNGKYPGSLEELYPQYIRSLKIFAAPGKESSLTMKHHISQKGMFVYKSIPDISNVKNEAVIVYQKKDVHSGGFFVLLKNGTVQWRLSNMYKRTVNEFEGSSVEVIE